MYRENQSYSLDLTKKTNYTNLNLELYGKLLVETDFHHDPTLRAEIGFIKRF